MSASYWLIYGLVTGFNVAIFCVSVSCLKAAQRLLASLHKEGER